MVLGVLGYKIFVPLLQKKSEEVVDENKELLLYITDKNNKFKAICQRTNEGFVVLEGSMIKKKLSF